MRYFAFYYHLLKQTARRRQQKPSTLRQTANRQSDHRRREATSCFERLLYSVVLYASHVFMDARSRTHVPEVPCSSTLNTPSIEPIQSTTPYKEDRLQYQKSMTTCCQSLIPFRPSTAAFTHRRSSRKIKKPADVSASRSSVSQSFVRAACIHQDTHPRRYSPMQHFSTPQQIDQCSIPPTVSDRVASADRSCGRSHDTYARRPTASERLVLKWTSMNGSNPATRGRRPIVCLSRSRTRECSVEITSG